MNSKLNVLIGEEMTRIFDFKVVVTNPNAVSEKEDKIFFPDIEKYYSEQEIETMMNDFWEFDRKMIHEKYNNLYNSLSKK